MIMDNWFDGILSEGQAAPARPLESGYKSEMGTKVGTAEILAQQGFQDFVPTVPTVPTEKQSPRKSEENTPKPGNPFTAVATAQPTPAPALPADLLERVNLICRLEQWPAADRAEWLGILRRQVEQDGTPVCELVACLDAHLAKHYAGVAGGDDRFDQFRVGLGVFANGAEGHMHLLLGEEGEQPRRLDRVRAVVEDHRDVDGFEVGSRSEGVNEKEDGDEKGAEGHEYSLCEHDRVVKGPIRCTSPNGTAAPHLHPESGLSGTKNTKAVFRWKTALGNWRDGRDSNSRPSA